MFYARSELHIQHDSPWWLPILVAADQAPRHTLPNSTSAQARGAEAKHTHISSSSGSAAADDLGSGQQRGFPLRILESIRSSYFCRTHVCVPLCRLNTGIKLALAHTFTFARVHPAWSSSCSHTFAKVGSELSIICTHIYVSGVRSVWSARLFYVFLGVWSVWYGRPG